MFRTIVWYSTVYDPILVEQANARIHRIGQVHPCSIYYLGYNGTAQSEVWTMVAKKVAAMQAIHGDISSGLAALLGDNNLIVQIQAATIEYDRRDSDITIDDLPPLVIDVIPQEVPAVVVEIPVEKRRMVTLPSTGIQLSFTF